MLEWHPKVCRFFKDKPIWSQVQEPATTASSDEVSSIAESI